jgi:hypothetical protein
MEPTARILLGEPNKRLSKPAELRFGTHGSMAINLKKGTFYDHENGRGGLLRARAQEPGQLFVFDGWHPE